MSLSSDRSKLKPSKLAHIVLRTNNFSALRKFYLDFLGAEIAFEKPDELAFLRYDDEHHRIGIIAVPDIKDKIRASNGLEHIAFAYDTLEDLMSAYEIRKSMGIKPFWCVNHGPTTSMYWHDPDGNTIETQYDNLDVAEADAFMHSDAFRTNPFGVDFDPEELVRRIKSGEPVETLIERADVGPRGMDSVPVQRDAHL